MQGKNKKMKKKLVSFERSGADSDDSGEKGERAGRNAHGQEKKRLDACLSFLRKPTDEEKFAGLLLISKHLREKQGQDIVCTLPLIADAVGTLFLTRLIRTRSRKDGKEIRAPSPQAILGINIVSTLAREPSLCPRFLPIFGDLLNHMDGCDPSHPIQSSLLLDLIGLCTALAQLPEAGIRRQAGFLLSIAKLIGVLSSSKKPEAESRRFALENIAIRAVNDLCARIGGARIQQDGADDQAASLTCVDALNTLASAFSKDQEGLKFHILSSLQALLGPSETNTSVSGWFLHRVQQTPSHKHEWPLLIGRGITEVLSSRVKPDVRASCLYLSLTMFKLLGSTWATVLFGEDGAKSSSNKGRSVHLAALVVSMAAVELQVNLLTDIPEVHLPGESDRAKLEVAKELKEKAEKAKKRREGTGQEQKPDADKCDSKRASDVVSDMLPTDEKVSIRLPNPSKPNNEPKLRLKKRHAVLCHRAVVCLELLDATLHFLCNEPWCGEHFLRHAIYASNVTADESKLDEAKLAWENIPVESLMPIRRALSDSMMSLITFFNDCQALGISLGESRIFDADDCEAQNDLDQMLIAGAKYIGTWMRLETEEHREKIRDLIPTLLAMKPSETSSQDRESVPYLIPGILETLSDVKAAETLLSGHALEKICQLITRRFAGDSPLTFNPIEIVLTCQVILELLETAGPSAASYATDEIAPYLHIIPVALRKVQKSTESCVGHDRQLGHYNQSLLLLALLFSRSALLLGPKGIALAMAAGKSASLGAVRSERAWSTIAQILIKRSICHRIPEDAPLLKRVLEDLRMCLKSHAQLAHILSKEASVDDIRTLRSLWGALAGRIPKFERKEHEKLEDITAVITSIDSLLLALRKK
mmetsp:Transcript_22260/g.54435  ORF Transcript_22260/g.54435 Transcript_22260/m.54435 type:complete len:876 (-) Transcript_22260:170-2797(-)|eukprot:CAMPEP_0114500338 /NCGR_PEP_ID=MMETSP0109-20121206/7908_1 /TAXON_ID=29199 /ORGANISM="Chlorarachnion reptans, Strain CCCM449" /LENGTH=875 /DNA_ID=CAMNT_0001677987 /DNA_START=224 /DNA_END=2851 /DNA_ORIENTATION=+